MQKQLTINLFNEGLAAIKDKRGRNISISAYSEMLARSIVAETQNTCVKNVMKEHGKDLIKMTEHFTSCPLCATYEGRVYSISGKDERFPSLKSVPGFSSGYNTIHPRCRHRLTPYIEKYQDVDKDKEYSNRPFEVDEEKEESVNQYFKKQKEKARLRNDRKQYEKYKQVLGEEAPKNFASFRKIKYNYSKRYEDIKSNYKIVNKYNVVEGEVSPSKIIELHNLNKEVRNEFTGSLKKDGNIAVMEFENNIYLSHSRIQNKDNKGFSKYKGNKTMVLLDKNREFKYLIVPKENGWPRHVDTEAKLFEYLNKINIDKNKKQEIFLITEKPMCESCKYVMEQFKKINKNITLNIIEGRVN